MHQIKTSEIAGLRARLLIEQNSICPLCQQVINPDQAVLDHDHKTGQIRSVLHRNCNLYIGALENNLVRNRITPLMLTAILENFQSYAHQLKPILHPTYQTPEQKVIKRKARAKRLRDQNKLK